MIFIHGSHNLLALFVCSPPLRYLSSVAQLHAELVKRKKRFLALVEIIVVSTFDRSLENHAPKMDVQG